MISFNDITDVIKQSNIIIFADDVVLYVADKDVKSVESKLSNDMASIAGWLDENELIINLKEGKTEALLFGKAMQFCKLDESLAIPYRHTIINYTKKYRYLGVEINATLNLNSFVDASFKHATTRLWLLSKIRDDLNMDAAEAIYQTMVLPLLTYCGVLNLKTNVNSFFFCYKMLKGRLHVLRNFVGQIFELQETMIFPKIT